MSTTNKHNVPHYKTLEIIDFYNRVYDFVHRYLIFVIAGLFASLLILIIFIWEPSTTISYNTQALTYKPYIQETGLIYPIHYFAERSIKFEGDNRILGLGGPIWRNQGMWNSIDNIVQYNGIILPRQISRSAWVPRLQQRLYSEIMVKTFLEGMGSSQVDLESIQSSLQEYKKETTEDSLLSIFGMKCLNKNLLTRQFCDLKLLESLKYLNNYDLSGHINEVQEIHQYIKKSNSSHILKQWCSILLQQYRYNAVVGIQPLSYDCSEEIQEEIQYISHMKAINKEIQNNNYTNTIYTDRTINYYKLISWYQYFMGKILSNQFVSGEDDIILESYDSFITKIVYSNSLEQPYGDIVAIFHQQYLLPWLQDREGYATTNEKKLTQKIVQTTNLIINGDSNQGINSVLSGSRIRSNEVLISQGLPYDILTGSSIIGTTNTPQDNTTTEGGNSQLSGTTNTSNIADSPSANSKDINQLISEVIGTTPTSIVQKNNLTIISYQYGSYSRFISVDLKQQGLMQLYFNSPESGAVKVQHSPLLLHPSQSGSLITIMDTYIKTI